MSSTSEILRGKMFFISSGYGFYVPNNIYIKADSIRLSVPKLCAILSPMSVHAKGTTRKQPTTNI